jgi:membrane-associated protease RseP (regulator of RpoE activity)
MRTHRFTLMILMAVAAQHAVASPSAAQQAGAGQVNVTTKRDTSFRVIAPMPNENLAVMDHALILRRIAEAMAEFDIEIRGPNRNTLERSAPTVFRALQREAMNHVSSINFMCSRRDARSAWLGVSLFETGLAESRAVYPKVLSVQAGSPAQAAGILSHDVIMKIDGVDMKGRSVSEFMKEPGKQITMVLDREGKERRVLANLDSGRTATPVTCEFAQSSPYIRILFKKDSSIARVLKLNPMNPADSGKVQATFIVRGGPGAAGTEVRSEYVISGLGAIGFVTARESNTASFMGALFYEFAPMRVQGKEPGKSEVRVLYIVDGNSPAGRGGLREGDVVSKVAKKEVHSITELRSRLEEVATATRKSIDIEVMRDAKRVPLKIQWQP